ncbi:hypothetical protein L2E82_16562 [Cichorium intybus]|uniref:Uncharacterized protein n=1 Tax=Cichorium intybus TaxID=13427 RepID=A0ACB9F5J3_CICIN|nr:hypothetical protein L2E82_16562 [Cichorium intybus]
MSFFSKPKTQLANIGAEAFALLDGFPSGHKSKSSSSTPPSQPPKKVFQNKYQPETIYKIPQVQATRVKMVMDSNEAAKMYGGIVIVDYPKRKSARREPNVITYEGGMEGAGRRERGRETRLERKVVKADGCA